MRRKDREVVDEKKICEIIDKCHCCRVDFYDNGEIYIVPLNFGYTKNDFGYIFYFHGAIAGRKYELLEKNPNVGFELDTSYKLKEGEMACNYSAYYQSIIGTGKASIIDNTDEKIKGLSLIMEKETGKKDWEFRPEMLEKVCVFKIDVDSLSCKENI